MNAELCETATLGRGVESGIERREIAHPVFELDSDRLTEALQSSIQNSRKNAAASTPDAVRRSGGEAEPSTRVARAETPGENPEAPPPNGRQGWMASKTERVLRDALRAVR